MYYCYAESSVLVPLCSLSRFVLHKMKIQHEKEITMRDEGESLLTRPLGSFASSTAADA